MKEKNMIIVTGSLGTGGLERIVANVANHYANKGWKVRVLLLLDSDVFHKLHQSIEVYSFLDRPILKNKVFYILPWINFIKKHIKEHDPCLIVAMTFKIGSLVRIACKNKDVRIIVREISDPNTRSKLSNAITDYFVENCSGIIFQTNWERICHSKKCQKIGRVIVNPVKIPVPAVETKRKVIVTMGRLLLKQKRQDILIKGFSIFHKKHPEYKLEIYGKGEDELVIKEMVEKENLTNSILFMGACPDVHERIKDASVFVITSAFEGLSNALLEAWLMGIPSISSNWNGADEIITNGYNGLIFEKENPEELARKICFYVENPEIAVEHASRAILMRSKYEIDNVMLQWEELLENK